jgi:imidazolonepropionase-like amidohydrolase
VVREHVEKTKVDNIKLSMSGEEITEHLRAEDTTFDDESVAAAVEEAHSLGVRVCAHARSDDAIMQCLQYGVDVVSLVIYTFFQRPVN